jgi:hypothetical protein
MRPRRGKVGKDGRLREWVQVGGAGCRVVDRPGCVSGNKMRTLAGSRTLYDRGGDGMEDQGVKSQTIVMEISTG